MGRTFGWLWAAYAVSAYGTGLGFGAFSVVAVQVLGAGPAQVAALSAAGLAIGAALAVPLGPWVEVHAKRRVMIATDLVRFAAMASVPVAHWLGVLSFTQLLGVAVATGTAKIAFTAASGAYLRGVVPTAKLRIATSRFEATTWSATIIGPPLGGAAIGLLGPVVTVLADAMSYLLSALGLTAIRDTGPRARPTRQRRWSDVAEGWRHLLAHPVLRPLLVNTVLVNGLIMATEPLLSVLMLAHLGFSPWQYGLAFAVPCAGGLIGARIARQVGTWTGLRVFGTLRVCWPLGLVLVQPGTAGLVTVVVVEAGLIGCSAVFAPVAAAYRLEHIDAGVRARALIAWSVTTTAGTAVITLLWGLLAQLTGPRAAIAVAGVLLLATPALLPRRDQGA